MLHTIDDVTTTLGAGSTYSSQLCGTVGFALGALFSFAHRAATVRIWKTPSSPLNVVVTGVYKSHPCVTSVLCIFFYVVACILHAICDYAHAALQYPLSERVAHKFYMKHKHVGKYASGINLLVCERIPVYLYTCLAVLGICVCLSWGWHQ